MRVGRRFVLASAFTILLPVILCLMAGSGPTEGASFGVGGERDWIDKGLDFLTGNDKKVPTKSGSIFGLKVGVGAQYSKEERLKFVVMLVAAGGLAVIILCGCCCCCAVCIRNMNRG